MDRSEVRELIKLLGAMYQPLLTGKKEIDTDIVDIWLITLKPFKYDEAKRAVAQLGSKKIYGKVQPNDIVSLIKPPLENQNKGIEFSTRLLDLQRIHGTDQMEEHVLNEFGKVGYSVYKQLKLELRELNVDDISTFKAQVRDIFNSYKEREQHNTLEALPYESKALEMINSATNKILENKKI